MKDNSKATNSKSAEELLTSAMVSNFYAKIFLQQCCYEMDEARDRLNKVCGNSSEFNYGLMNNPVSELCEIL